MSTCPYCGKEYPKMTIPPLYEGGRPMTITSNRCGCDGEVAAEEEQERRDRYESAKAAWKRCGVPSDYDRVKPNHELLDSLNGSSLYIYGTFGTGKTTTAAALLKSFVSRNHKDGYAPARFVTAYDWLASMRTSRWGTEEDAFQRAAGVRFLVFDDIGKGKQTDWAVERVARLIDVRLSDGRQTIITSNYSIEELGDRCAASGDEVSSGAMISRLSKKNVICLPMNGSDMRLTSNV